MFQISDLIRRGSPEWSVAAPGWIYLVTYVDRRVDPESVSIFSLIEDDWSTELPFDLGMGRGWGKVVRRGASDGSVDT